MHGEPDEIRREYLPVDSTEAPVIVQCPATGCEDLNLWTMEGAPGHTWFVVCGAGHLALISKVPDEETP